MGALRRRARRACEATETEREREKAAELEKNKSKTSAGGEVADTSDKDATDWHCGMHKHKPSRAFVRACVWARWLGVSSPLRPPFKSPRVAERRLWNSLVGERCIQKKSGVLETIKNEDRKAAQHRGLVVR